MSTHPDNLRRIAVATGSAAVGAFITYTGILTYNAVVEAKMARKWGAIPARAAMQEGRRLP